jgi:murein DD-endopeptidase MepM/ murein hydrolase activator NlpD
VLYPYRKKTTRKNRRSAGATVEEMKTLLEAWKDAQEKGEPAAALEKAVMDAWKELRRTASARKAKLMLRRANFTRTARGRNLYHPRKRTYDYEGGEARELKLYIDNEYELDRQRQSIERNMTRKLAQDKYDSELAVKGFMWLVESGAKKYARDFGGTWHQLFPKPVRIEVAKLLRDDFEAEVGTNPQDYEQHVFKKDRSRWKERYTAKARTSHTTRDPRFFWND